MTDRIKEQLSTFLDGELPEPESALLLKRLERDDELRGALSRYSLIGAVLRSDGDVPAARQVAARVSAAIAREPVRAATLLRRPGREVLVRSLGGLAIAAGVAFASVLLVQQLAVPDSATPQMVMAELVESPIVPVADEEQTLAASYVTPPAADAPAGLPPAELANYLVAHYGYASPLVRRSVGAGLIGASHATALVDVPPEDPPGRAVIARPHIALALLLAAAPAAADSGQEWLNRMTEALNNTSYVGEFVSESAGRSERLSIVHRVRDGVVWERLVSMSGNGRELVRENDEVVVYLPDQKLAIIERRAGRSDLLGALPQFEGAMSNWYKVDYIGQEGTPFGPAAVVAVRPVDGYRFGYRLWIDATSHMPVRSDLSDSAGRVVERLRFTRLEFDRNIPDSAFEPALDRSKLRWVRQSPQADDSTPAWRAGRMPPGFRLSVSGVQAVAGTTVPVSHLVFSDGLASVSVFIHPPAPGKPPVEGSGRSGVASAFSTVVDGHQVTAVGEVPPRTLKIFATGLRPTFAPAPAQPAGARGN